MAYVDGGCVCGALRYRFNPKGAITDYCHCRTCRRWSGAPITAWAQVPVDQFEIVAGMAKAFPSSSRGIRYFCDQCGSSVYMMDSEGKSIGIMLGTLDNAEGLQPQGHGWVSEKIKWFHINDDLPRWPQDAPYDRQDD